jgi:WD40 repeat protein
MPRPERAVDPDAGPVQSLAARLRDLRRQAGNPGYRELAGRAGYSVTALANAAGGRRLPSLAVTLAFVRACGGDPVDWERRWRQAALDAPKGQEGAGTEDPPYRGLVAYDVADAERFFGRGRLVARLVSMLEHHRFVAVFGVSGSGKSSLLRAGLVPALAAAATILTPGAEPLAALRRALARTPRRGEALLLVDQFEELFTHCPEPAERAAFVAELATLARRPEGRTRVVIGVRADFYARCTELPALAGLLAGASVPVGPLDEDELREVVTEPARAAGCGVERALVAKLLVDAAGQPGALPLVSHAMLETWRQRRGDLLTLAGYQAAGGVGGAIAQTAEAVYQRLQPGQRETAERLLTRLVSLGEGVEDTRRRVARAELDLPDADEVVHRLAAARLLVLGPDTVEIAHEALIRAWPRLREWLHADREALRRHRQLTEASQIWRSHGMDPGALYRGLRLAAWDGRDAHDLNGTERDFLSASRARRDWERRAGRRRVRLTVAGLAAAVAVVSVLAATAWVQAGRARAERDLAYSRQLVAEARTQLQVDTERGLLLARRAYQERPTEEAEAVLRQAVVDARTYATLTVSPGGFAPVAVTRDGARLAVAHGSSAVVVWDLERGTRAAELPAGGASLVSLAFGPDGRHVAAGGRDGRVRIWDLRAPSGPAVVGGHAGAVDSVAFSPDGHRVASGGADGTVRVWDTAARTTPEALPGHRGRVRAVAFSPDGQRIASGGDDGIVRIRRLDGRDSPVLLDGHGGVTWSLAFSPDGRRLVSGHDDGAVRVWPADATGPPVVLRTSIRLVRAVAFSPDGQRIATTGTGGTIFLWDATGPGRPLELRGHTHSALAVSFTPDGGRLVTAAADGTARVWDTAGRADPTVLRAPGAAAREVAFSPDGRRVAVAGGDGSIRVWDTAGAGDPVVLRGHRGPVLGVVYHPDGTRLASGGADGAIRIWDLDRRRATAVLPNGRPVRPIAFTAGGRLAGATVDAVDGLDTHLHVWDAGGPWAARRDTRAVDGYGVGFSADGRRVATARQDGTVELSDPAGGGDVTVLRGHEGPVHDVAFGPDGRRVATASQDGTIRVWNVDGTTAFVLPGHPGGARTVQYTADGRWLVSTGTDETVRIWKAGAAAAPVVFGGYGPSVVAATVDRDGTRVATVHSDGTARVWPCEVCGPIEQVAELAARRTTRQLG